MIRAVLFDAGGVLLGPDWVRLARDAAARGVRVDASRLAAQEGPAMAVMEGTTDAERWRSYVAAAFAGAGASLGVAMDLAAELRIEHDRTSYWDAVYPDVSECLTTLRPRMRLGIVSNSNGRLIDALERVDLARFFDVVIDSALVGIEKPDPRIFALALGRLDVAPRASAFVGDHPDLDVRGAAAVGMRSFYLDRHDSGARPPGERILTLGALAGALSEPE